MLSLRRLCLLNRRPVWKYDFCKSRRPLYNSAYLGIDSFILYKKETLNSIQNLDVFKTQLKHLCGENEKGLVFLEDLRKAIAATDSDEDLELLISLIRKYCRQKQVVVLNGYNFGPEVMRLLHLKNKFDEAVELVKDEDLFQFFQHRITLTVLLDMLFKNCEYEEVIMMYEMYQNKLDFRFPSTAATLVYLAACYKLNTAECFEKALQVHKVCVDDRKKVPLRNALLFAAFAIKQNQPACTIDALSYPYSNFIVENLKCMAYAQAKRFDVVLCSLRIALSSPGAEKFFLTSEAVSFIENEINKEGCNEPYRLEFENLKEELLVRNLIKDEPLDTYLCGDINYYKTKSHVLNTGIFR